VWAYVRRNPNLLIGLVLLSVLLLFSIVGPLFVDVTNAEPLSVSPEKPPSLAYPFGTDSQGRDLLAVMVAGTPLTLRIGCPSKFPTQTATVNPPVTPTAQLSVK